MTHKSNVFINRPKFEFIDTQSNSSFSFNRQYRYDSHNNQNCSTTRTNIFDPLGIGNTEEPPDPLDLCEIKIEPNTLELDYLADIKSEVNSIAQQACDVGDHNYAFISRLEHSYAKTYQQGLEEIERVFEDQRIIEMYVDMSKENGGGERNLNNDGFIEVNNGRNVTKKTDINVNNNKIVNMNSNLSKEKEIVVNNENNLIIIDLLIEAEDINKKHQEINVHCLNITKESYKNQAQASKRQSKQIKQKITEEISKKQPENQEYISTKQPNEMRIVCNKVIEYKNQSKVSELQTYIYENQSNQIRLDCPKLLEYLTQPEVLEKHSRGIRSDRAEKTQEGNETQANVSKNQTVDGDCTENNQEASSNQAKSQSEGTRLDCEGSSLAGDPAVSKSQLGTTFDCGKMVEEVIRHQLETFQAQPEVSQNQPDESQNSEDRQKWQIDVEALLTAMYLKESGVQVSNDLPLKPLESVPIIHLLSDGSDCEISTEKNSTQQTNNEKNKIVNITYECNSCKFCTPHEPVMKMHLKMHAKQKQKPSPHRCPKCSYKTKYKYNLIAHSKIHSKEIKTYNCPKCSYTVKNKAHLFKHLNSHAKTLDKQKKNIILPHPIVNLSYECNTCKYWTPSEVGMQRHLNKHKINKDKPKLIPKPQPKPLFYRCNQCSFKTHLKPNLSVHYKTHIKEKQKPHYECPKCDYSTAIHNQLIKHFEIHVEPPVESLPLPKGFNCRLCGFTTDKTHRMEIHMVKHARKKSYRCYTCDFVSWYADELALHKQLHLNVAHCPVCNQTMSGDAFDSHRKIHAVKCNECYFVAGSEEILKVHLMDVHSVKTLS